MLSLDCDIYQSFLQQPVLFCIGTKTSRRQLSVVVLHVYGGSSRNFMHGNSLLQLHPHWELQNLKKQGPQQKAYVFAELGTHAQCALEICPALNASLACFPDQEAFQLKGSNYRAWVGFLSQDIPVRAVLVPVYRTTRTGIPVFNGSSPNFGRSLLGCITPMIGVLL